MEHFWVETELLRVEDGELEVVDGETGEVLDFDGPG